MYIRKKFKTLDLKPFYFKLYILRISISELQLTNVFCSDILNKPYNKADFFFGRKAALSYYFQGKGANMRFR